MALPDSLNTREFRKFSEVGSDVAINVNVVGGLLAGVNYDAVDVQQTSATVETYVFKTGGLAGTTVKTIVLTYTSSAKTDLDSVVAT